MTMNALAMAAKSERPEAAPARKALGVTVFAPGRLVRAKAAIATKKLSPPRRHK